MTKKQKNMMMKGKTMVSNLKFPVLEIYKGSPSPCGSIDYLVTTTSLALRKGYFSDLRIIDSQGKEFLVKRAKKIHRISRFWEVIMFFNPRIQVNLDIEETGKTVTTEEVRRLVLNDFREWHGWESRGDFDELKTSVENAHTIAEIIQLIDS